MWKYPGIIFLCLLTVSAGTLSADELTPEQEQWLESDELTPPEFQINMGELEFLGSPPVKPVPHSDNTFIIDQESLSSGWLTLRQCHINLDPVPLLEVTYQYRQMEALRIIEQKNIGHAWIEEQSVQMEDIRKDNRLCIEAKIRVFYAEGDHFMLINGPYHRRFLDGYFPYHVSLHVLYPPERLTPVSFQPEAQPGFDIQFSKGRIDIDAWFEGRLMTEIVFRTRRLSDAGQWLAQTQIQ